MIVNGNAPEFVEEGGRIMPIKWLRRNDYDNLLGY